MYFPFFLSLKINTCVQLHCYTVHTTQYTCSLYVCIGHTRPFKAKQLFKEATCLIKNICFLPGKGCWMLLLYELWLGGGGFIPPCRILTKQDIRAILLKFNQPCPVMAWKLELRSTPPPLKNLVFILV